MKKITSHKPTVTIEASNLVKHFNDQIAVNGFSVNVTEGQIFGLLGPNAAGKTTIIRILCGIIERDSGQVNILNLDIADAKNYFGYVAQHFGQYEELTVWENLKFYAQMYGIKDKERLEQLLVRYQLKSYKNHMAGSLSGGFQRRLALVCALAHDPKVLFLDEPTAGIDPATRKLLWDDFYNLSMEGKTLFVTTHYMEEAQRCHQLAFIDNGQTIATGTPDDIKKSLGKVTIFKMKLAYQPELHQILSDINDIILVHQFGTELRIITKPVLSLSQLEKYIQNYTKDSVELSKTELNLEDVFIALTQHEENA